VESLHRQVDLVLQAEAMNEDDLPFVRQVHDLLQDALSISDAKESLKRCAEVKHWLNSILRYQHPEIEAPEVLSRIVDD
jgi:uncharacterized protein (DUF305 family)